MNHKLRLIRIKAHLKENHITNRVLAHNIGMREDKLSNTLNGKRPMSAQEYVDICRFCGCWFDRIEKPSECDFSQSW